MLPLYGGLPSNLQAKIFRETPKGIRKCIVSTNIAETSITIRNVSYVIDSGFVKVKAYNARTGISTLCRTLVSRASAIQRG